MIIKSAKELKVYQAAHKHQPWGKLAMAVFETQIERFHF